MNLKIVGFYVLTISCLVATSSFAQNYGQIVQPATTTVMNPHANGWVTLVPTYVPPVYPGFDTTKADYKLNCINQFEYTMYGIPEIGKGDVLKDNIGNSCGITDLIPDKKGYSVYTIRDANNKLIFRFRLGSLNSSVEAYSILIDTDQKFGKVGDPGVTASTADPNWTAGNPGFEIDITLINNSNGNVGGVFVYDIDGIDSCPTPLAKYDYNSHVQLAKADTYTCGDFDYFFDYYVPLDSVVAKFNANKNNVSPARSYDLAVSTPLRYAALTNQNAGCSMAGKISDISGVDNSTATYSTSSSTGIYNSFVALVTSQCGTPLNDLLTGAGGFDKNVVTKPTIDPVNILQTVITGTTVESGIYIKVEVYPQLTPTTWASTPIETKDVTEAIGVTNWSVTLTRPLAAFDLVVATTQKDQYTVPCANNGANNSSSTAVVVTCLLEATLNPTNVSCNGGSDGSITAVIAAAPNNGTSPYTYLWNTSPVPVQTTATALNLPNLLPGTYSLILKDASGCQAILNPVTITQPAALNATVTTANVSCNGANDGTITVSAPAGGYGTYQYSINGGTSWQASGSFTGLSNGIYNVLIRDAAHTICVVDLDGITNTTITQPAILTATVSSTNVTCNGANDGTITVTAPAGGYGTYEYSINGGTSWQSSGSFTNLANGTYNVLIRDAAHVSCLKDLDGSTNTTITQPAILSATVSSTNVTIFGASDGTITISSPSGGSGAYQYSINGGTTWQASGSFTGLASGTYNVEIRDAAQTTCVVDLDGTSNTIILQPSGPLTATISTTNVTCNGSSDGTITISSPSGGYGTYEYSINGGTSWQSSGSFAGLASGTYNVFIRDAAYTTDVVDLDGAGNTVITQPAVLSATVSSTNVTTFGASDGTITVSSPSGGSGSYQFSINGGTTWQSSGVFSSLPNGTYNVLIRDAAHTTCIVDLDGVTNTTILQPSGPLTATVTTTNVTCNGANDGTITISTPSGGYGTYEYSINGGTSWQSSGSFTSLSNATYNVFIRDAAYTTDVVDLDGATNTVITQPVALSATVSSTNVSGNGASDGTITISSPSGGYGTYEYSINGGTSWQASGSFTGLPNGTYNVYIRDAAHTSCTKDLDGAINTIITQPAALSATISSTNVTCNGAGDGTITISSPSGGYGTYEYSVNGGTSWQSSGSFTGLSNGTYNVLIRDAAHTTIIVDLDGVANTIISQPAVLSASISSTNVTSNGANNGTITISSPTGGYGTYEYSINGGISWQASGSFTGLSNGTYNVLIRDAAHTSCVVDLDGTANTILTQPATLSATVTSTNVTCNGASDGTITVSSPSGGNGTYEYTKDGGSTWQASGSFTGLISGTYDVRIRDAAQHADVEDLDGTINTVISQPAVLSATVSTTNVSSTGASDGTITISSPSGGYGTYEYSINGGTSWQASGTFTGLSNGTYNILIRDAAHTTCIVDLDGVANTTIIQPTNPLSASVASTNVTCNGANDGTITISSPAGGYGTYEYSINGGTSWQASGSFTNLANGSYNVKIRDAAFPIDVVDLDGAGNTTITQPATLSATVSTTNVSATGANDGSISITAPTGGYGTYGYSINGGTSWQASGTFSGLSNGTYNVLIRDAAHTSCVIDLDGTINTTIIQPSSPLSATVTTTNVTCNSASDGTITISSAAGGYGTYQYSVNGGTSWQASGLFTGLSNGSYNVLIRDAAFTTNVVDLDGAGNTTISQPAALTATISTTNATSNGANDGTIMITSPNGGYGTYQYSINGGTNWQSSGSFTGLGSGTYNVLIRDAAHTTCVADLDGVTNTTITQPAVLSATVTTTNVTCNGANDGTITISSPSGGYGTYQYSVNGGTSWQSSGSFTGLSNGTYNVLIRDAVFTTNVVDLDGTSNTSITQPAVLSASISSTNLSGNGSNDGTITITSPSGGYGTYEYTINGGTSWQSSGSFTGLSTGTYNILIRDAAHTTCVVDLNGATNTTITQPAVLSATISSTNVTCNGASDGTITVSSPSGGYGTYGYSINGGTSWQSSGSFTGLPNGTYNVLIRDAAYPTTIVDLDGAGNTTISQPTVLSGSVSFTNVSAFGGFDGTITVSSPSGGSGTYQYTVNGGTSWQSSGLFTGLSSGTYDVQIRDAAHTSCVIDLDGSTNTTLIQPSSPLTALYTWTNVSCNGGNDGTITISSPSGGYGTYEYTINGGINWQSSGSFTSLSSALYNVQIRDAVYTADVIDLDGSANTLVSQPGAMSALVLVTNVTCNGANDGIINVAFESGGYGTYEYSINGGTTWQTSGLFTGLAPSTTYDVLMRDAAHIGCFVDLDGATNTTVTEPAALSASIATTNVTCNGANDGSITISSPTGGSGTYEYTNNGGTSWQALGTFTALANGIYDVQIRDVAHPSCVIDLDGASNTTITQPAVLSATVASTNVTAFGANDGTITISAPAGGYGTYEYSIDGGTTWQASGSFTGLPNATYNVWMRDAAHTACTIDLDGSVNTTIIQPTSPLSASVSSTNVSCNGGNDGTITISSPAGGYGTYEYSINGGTTWQASGSFTGLISNTYNVQIRDAASITAVLDLDGASNTTITQPAVLSATVAFTNVTAFGANDGTITISAPAGGYGTYEYSINGGTNWQASGSFTGLSNATYNILIRDAAHTACVIDLDGSVNTTIIQPTSPLSGTVTTTNVSCNGGNDGTITISSPAGGYGTYEYSINGGTTWQASGSFTGLSSGSYNVQIRDAAYPTDVVDLDGASNTTITQPTVLSATVAFTNVTAFGANDGTITISAPAGGYGTYEYSIDGGTTWQASGSFTGLPNATYNVWMRDAAHTACTIDLDGSVNTTIIQPTSPLSASVSSTNVSCNGGNDGTITISSPAGGYGTYEYSINGGTSWQASGSFTGLISNTYNVQIRDAASITAVLDLDGASNTIITQPAVLSASITMTNVTANGANDGTITISTPAGGYGTYEYSINGGTNWQTSGSFTGLANATYNVLMRDAAHTACVIDLDGSANTIITQPAPLSATVTSTNVTCSGVNDGTITISSPTGGYGTYEYSIDGGTSWQSSGSYTGLAPASTYNVLIRDAAHTNDVVDLDGVSNTTVIQPTVAMTASVTTTNTTCNGASDGSITISSSSGGYGTYEYSIDGGTTWQSSGSFTGLAPSTAYNLMIRDAAHTGCVVDLDGTINTSITQPNPLTATVTLTNVTANNANDGTITITSPSGGYGTYEYSIDGGTTWQSSGSFTGLPNATYNVWMRDATHTTCSTDLDGSVNTTITQPAPLSAIVTPTNATCSGVNDGTITISSPTGGYGTYEYSIDGGTSWQSSGSYTGLAPASTYNVLIRDAAHTNNVVDLDGAGNTTTIQSSIALTATVTATNITCNGATDGSISISSSSGGSGSYEYSLDGGTTWQPSGLFTNLAPASTYNLQIRDASHTGCVVDLDGSVNTSIVQPNALTGTVTYTNVSSIGANDGTITISAPAGGYGTYQYSIDGGTTWQSSGSFTGLSNATYNVLMRDAAHPGCVVDLDGSVGTIIIQPTSVLSATITSTNVTCNSANDGTITVSSPAGGYGTYEYSINGGTAWQASGSFTGISSGIYNVQIRDAAYHADVVDLDGTSNTQLTQPSPLQYTDSLTNGCGTGRIDIAVTGGATPYTYSWSNGAQTNNLTDLSEGTYSVTITDANQCVLTASFDIKCILRIYQAVSPNGDGKNDYWRIDKIDEYPGNTVRLFDRFNNMVYETHGYSNETNNWTGQANHGLTKGSLPDDTYFYWVDLGSGLGQFSGFVILKTH